MARNHSSQGDCLVEVSPLQRNSSPAPVVVERERRGRTLPGMENLHYTVYEGECCPR